MSTSLAALLPLSTAYFELNIPFSLSVMLFSRFVPSPKNGSLLCFYFYNSPLPKSDLCCTQEQSPLFCQTDVDHLMFRV